MRTLLTQKLLPIFLLAAFLTACPIVTAQPPPTPQGLGATATSSTGISVSWVASPGATSYTLERRTDATGFVGVGGKITTTTFADSSLQGATKYTYHIKAVSDGGTSDPSPEVSATTPTDLVNLQATATSSTTVNLTWSAVASATNYTLERKEGSGAYSTVETPTGTSFTDYTGLTPNTTYTYKVTAQPIGPSAAGEKTVTTFPSNPTIGTPTVSTSSVKLDWTAPTEPGTYTYSIERKEGSGAYALLGNQSATTFTDSNVTVSTYTYRIKAVSAGVSSSGAERTVTVQLPAPTGFITSDLTAKKVTLTWAVIPGSGISYTLTRNENSAGFVPLTTTTNTTYTDSSLTAGKTYVYRLQAVKGSATSPTVDSGSVSTVLGAPIKVLFIGNSLTYVNNVPLMVQTLANDAGELRPFQFEAVVLGGASLACHYTQSATYGSNCPSSNALTKIAQAGANWNYVVLQEGSEKPVCDFANFNNYAGLFNTQIQAVGAKTILALNWVRTDVPCSPSSQTNFLTYSNDGLATATYGEANTISSAVAPLGTAWATLGAPSPTPALYQDDRHANANGSYLAAATYYALFYKKSPVGLTRTVQVMANGTVDNPNAATSSTTIDAGIANTLQTKAWEIYNAMPNQYKLP